jgi:hypothetical protein
MNRRRIPDHDHVARYCSYTKTSEVDGSVQATAFMLRPNEYFLSVNWLEYFNCLDRKSEIVEIQKIYSINLDVGSRAKIAVLNVGKVCNKVFEESDDHRILNVIHDPLENDPSHSGIYNLKQNDVLIAELIRETICEAYSAR